MPATKNKGKSEDVPMSLVPMHRCNVVGSYSAMSSQIKLVCNANNQNFGNEFILKFVKRCVAVLHWYVSVDFDCYKLQQELDNSPFASDNETFDSFWSTIEKYPKLVTFMWYTEFLVILVKSDFKNALYREPLTFVRKGIIDIEDAEYYENIESDTDIAKLFNPNLLEFRNINFFVACLRYDKWNAVMAHRNNLFTSICEAMQAAPLAAYEIVSLSEHLSGLRIFLLPTAPEEINADTYVKMETTNKELKWFLFCLQVFKLL